MKELIVPDAFQLKKMPKQDRSRKQVELICQSALQLVNEQGFRQLTTNAIAARAGVDIASLYQYFPNKEAILYFISDRWLAEIRAVYTQYDQDEGKLNLTWQAFFGGIVDSWSVPNDDLKLNAFQQLWRNHPEFQALETYQRGFHGDFFVRHLKRFNASGTPKQWREVANFLFFIEDSINEVLAMNKTAYGEYMLSLFKETFLFHLSKFLNK